MNVIKERDNQDLIEAFWKRVNALIRQCGTTQSELSEKLNPKDPSPRKIQNMSGKRLPDAEEVVIIAKALDTTVEYLVTGESEKGLSPDALKLVKLYEGTMPEMKKKTMEMAEFFSTFKRENTFFSDEPPADEDN